MQISMEFTALFLCAFLSIPIGSYIRVFASRLLARFSGIKEEVPYAFSFPIRMAIGASIALGVSFIYVLLCGKEISFISGAIVSSATSIAMSVVIISRLLTRK